MFVVFFFIIAGHIPFHKNRCRSLLWTNSVFEFKEMPFHPSGYEIQAPPRPISHCQNCQNIHNKNILEVLFTVSSHGKVDTIRQDVSTCKLRAANAVSLYLFYR